MTRHPSDAQLVRFAQGEQLAERAVEIAFHVAGCAECAARIHAERALDDFVVRSAPLVDAHAADRALERLWRAVDAGALDDAGATDDPGALDDVGALDDTGALDARSELGDVGEATDAPTRRPALRLVTALVAAALLLALLPWLIDGERDDPRAPVVAEAPPALDGGAHPFADPAPEFGPDTDLEPARPDAAPPRDEPGAPAPPVDLERLAATRARVAAALLDVPVDPQAAPGASAHPAVAAETVSAALAPLRAEGWPVDAHLRGLVLGDDVALAERALEHVLAVGGAPSLLAQALRAGVGGDALLERLPVGASALGDSPALVAALAERAPHDARARALLLAEPGPRTRRALDELFGAALERARLADDPRDADFATLCAELPHAAALPWLVRAARPDDAPALADWARARFLERAAVAPNPAADSLRPLLADAPDDDPRLEWLVDARLDALVPDLAQRLDAREHAAAARARLARLATPAAAYALFVELAEDQRGRADPHALRLLLHERPALAEALGARAADAHGAALSAFAETLSDEPAERLLLGAFAALPVGADPRGRRAELLTALARLGGERAGLALLARVDALPADDAVLALAWATSARLAGDAATARWSAQGGDPGTLAQVAADVGERADRDVRPSPRLLRPLERELPRVVALR